MGPLGPSNRQALEWTWLLLLLFDEGVVYLLNHSSFLKADPELMCVHNRFHLRSTPNGVFSAAKTFTPHREARLADGIQLKLRLAGLVNVSLFRSSPSLLETGTRT